MVDRVFRPSPPKLVDPRDRWRAPAVGVRLVRRRSGLGSIDLGSEPDHDQHRHGPVHDAIQPNDGKHNDHCCKHHDDHDDHDRAEARPDHDHRPAPAARGRELGRRFGGIPDPGRASGAPRPEVRPGPGGRQVRAQDDPIRVGMAGVARAAPAPASSPRTWSVSSWPASLSRCCDRTWARPIARSIWPSRCCSCSRTASRS